MATWLVPRATQTELIAASNLAVTNPSATGAAREGDLVFNTTMNTLMIGFTDENNLITYGTVGPNSAITFATLSAGIVVSDDTGNPSVVDISPDEVIIRNTADDGWMSTKVTNDLINDSSISVTKIEPVGTGSNEVLITDETGNITTVTVGEGTILARDTGGNLAPQKLQPSMVNNGSIPFAKLPRVNPGQVLGVPVSESINPSPEPLMPIDISSFAGSSVTSSVVAPADPNDNDLWYYCGEQTGDTARLYIYQRGMWLDASPPILNTEPGPAGDAGPAGMDGASVSFIAVQDRLPTDDIILEFYSSTMASPETLLSTATIPVSDIIVGSDLPSLPMRPATGTAQYTLSVPSGTAPAAWVTSAGSSIDFTREVGSYVLQDEDIGVDLLLDMSSFGLGSPISAAHTLTYNGFVLNSNGDYMFNNVDRTIAISAGVSGVLTVGQTLDMTSFSASLS